MRERDGWWILMEFAVAGAYKEADEGAEGDDPEAAEAGVGEHGAEDGEEVGDGVPVVEHDGGEGARHEVPLGEVQDHVGRQPERGHLLEDLVRCRQRKSKSPSDVKNTIKRLHQAWPLDACSYR